MEEGVADCGHKIIRGEGIGSGKAIRQDGATCCYPCAEANERMDFSQADKYHAYVEEGSGNLITWTGAILATLAPYSIGESNTGWHRSTIYSYRWNGPKGSKWYGKNGGPGMFVTAHRAKAKEGE